MVEEKKESRKQTNLTSVLKQVASRRQVTSFRPQREITLSCRRQYCCCFSEPAGDTRL